MRVRVRVLCGEGAWQARSGRHRSHWPPLLSRPPASRQASYRGRSAGAQAATAPSPPLASRRRRRSPPSAPLLSQALSMPLLVLRRLSICWRSGGRWRGAVSSVSRGISRRVLLRAPGALSARTARTGLYYSRRIARQSGLGASRGKTPGTPEQPPRASESREALASALAGVAKKSRDHLRLEEASIGRRARGPVRKTLELSNLERGPLKQWSDSRARRGRPETRCHRVLPAGPRRVFMQGLHACLQWRLEPLQPAGSLVNRSRVLRIIAPMEACMPAEQTSVLPAASSV